MRALGTYLLSGCLQAAAATALLAVISLWVPILSYLSGVPLALATLRKGSGHGFGVLLTAVAILFAIMLLVGPHIVIAAFFGIGVWLPAYFCCRILRSTKSQGWAVLAAGVIATLYIVAIHYLIDDVPAWWLQQLQQITAQLETVLTVDDQEQLRLLLEEISPIFNAIVAAGIVVGLLCTTFLARWWQAILFNPGGFRREFYALLIPLAVVFLSLTGIILIVVGGAEKGAIGTDVLIIIVVLYVFQGLSGVHRIVDRHKLSVVWLALNYALLVIMPKMFLLLALLGLVDSLVKYKQSAIPPRDDG